jgi:hypothetical protein
MADYYGKDTNNTPKTISVTDPLTNAAVSTDIVNNYEMVVITLTGAGNTQTIQSPTDTATVRTLLIVNNDTSTNSIPIVANSVTFTVTPGEAKMFIWDGTAWVPIDMGITEIPVPVTQGGTGLVTITDHGIMLGSGTDAVTPMSVGTTGQLVKGVSGADPTWSTTTLTDGSNESTFTNGTGSLKFETGSSVINQDVTTDGNPQFATIELGHASDTTLSRTGSGDIAIEGNAVYRVGGTDVAVADGGTGTSTLTDHGILLGSGTDAITPMTALAAGEIVVGVGGADPHALAAGATTKILVGGGAADPVWTEATGTGAPVRATSPTITTPIIANALPADGAYVGTTIPGVLGETVAFGELVYLKAADSRWWKAQANVTATSGAVHVGYCVIAGNAAGATAILTSGIIRADGLFDTFTISAPVHISAATAGKTVTAAPSGTTGFVVRIVGHALDDNTVHVNISNDYVELA